MHVGLEIPVVAVSVTLYVIIKLNAIRSNPSILSTNLYKHFIVIVVIVKIYVGLQ